MSINLRLSSSPSGTQNVFDNNLDFSSFGGSPGASGATNLAAVSAFNTAYAALSGRTRLYIPPGTYTSSTGFFFANTTGIAGSLLTIDGYGVTLTGQSGSQNSIAGNAGISTSGTAEARFVTNAIGDQTITLVTAGQTSRFSVGQWCCVSGVNMQGAGDPPNLGVLEFKKIQSIGSGTLTFTDPLTNVYKDTWPVYTTGRGGPATVYPMQGFWDQEVEVRGIRFTDTSQLTYGKSRVIQWTDCLFDTYGPCPSVNKLFRALRSTATGFGGIEIDKCIDRIEILDSTIRAVDFQSSSVNDVYVRNLTQPVIGGLSGPRWRGGGRVSNTFIDVSGTSFSFNVMNYGVMGPTSMTNVSMSAGDWVTTTTPFSDCTEEGGGILSYVNGPNPPSNLFHYWAVPGQNCVLVDSSNNWARSFQVTDVYQSGGRTYVVTNLPFPVPSTINGKSSPWKIASHPCADLTMVNCSGNSLFTTQSALPAHTPFQSWTL